MTINLNMYKKLVSKIKLKEKEYLNLSNKMLEYFPCQYLKFTGSKVYIC